jgi:hypothetical protein
MNENGNMARLKKGLEEFLSLYPPFLRRYVLPGLCSLVFVVFVLVLAVVGSCMNCAGTCVYMGKRLTVRDTECRVDASSAFGYIGAEGESCVWGIRVDEITREVCFECDDDTGDFHVSIMSEGGELAVDGYDLEKTPCIILRGPKRYTVIIYTTDGFGHWSAAWD